jgi:hypothetical protein
MYPIILFRVRRFGLNFFLVLRERVFVYIFSVSNEDENERRTLGKKKFGSQRNGIRLHFIRFERNRK